MFQRTFFSARQELRAQYDIRVRAGDGPAVRDSLGISCGVRVSVSLRSYTFYNLSGSLVPAAAALVTIPLLLARIGEVRFGILSLVWLILGHFAIFDFGLSRATANRIARVPKDDLAGARKVFWTSVWMNLGAGAAGALLLSLAAEPLLTHAFDLSSATRQEVLGAIGWIAAAVPLATVAGVLGGALEGRERFYAVNTMQAVGAVAMQVAPLIAAYAFATSVDVLIQASVLGRALSLALLLGANLLLVAPGAPCLPDRMHARELFGYGAWISVSALIVPFFVTLDKFVVAGVLGAAAVAYYSVPDQAVRRISALPIAITRSIFPRISAASGDARALSGQAARISVCVVTPLVAMVTAFMSPVLALWIDREFAARASAPGILLAAGIWLNSVAMIPSVYLQASGRPDATAKAHVIEIFPHIAVLWICVHSFGTIGAAAAMFAVTALDAALLMGFARMPIWRAAFFRQGAAWVIGACVAGFWLSDATTLGSVTFAAVLAAGAAIWSVRTAPELLQFAAGALRRASLAQRGH